MADYKGIKGFKVQSLASDPSGPEGQVWYNTASAALKYQSSVGAWASGGNINNTRTSTGAAGTQTAGIIFAGGAPYPKQTETYDGTTWTEVAELLTGSGYNSGFGTQTAAIFQGGNVAPGVETESWNGTSWSEVADAPFGTYAKMSTGTQTAGLQGGGGTPPGTPVTESIEWDGTSWTETGDINTGRIYTMGGGTQTAAFMAGGQIPPYQDVVETYNGSTWSTSPTTLNTARGA